MPIRARLSLVLLLCITQLLVGGIPSATAQSSSVDVCIDPGHSLDETGAFNQVGDASLREVDINLDVSKRLAEQLQAAGRTYYFTWHTDSELPAASPDGNSNGRERAKICNDANARVVVSVHTNSVADDTRDGVWMGYHGSESQQFAKNMLDLTFENLFTDTGIYSNAGWNDENILNYGTEVFANSLLIHTDVPAIIFEPLFMSDDASSTPEFHALLTPIYGDGCNDICRRAQIAATLFQGVEAELQRLDGDTTNVPPTASFTYNCSDLSCNFTDSSTDGDGSIASWHWDFGDGASSTLQDPSHTYDATGDYSVTLVATDNAGATDSTVQTISVSTDTGDGRNCPPRNPHCS